MNVQTENKDKKGTLFLQCPEHSLFIIRIIVYENQPRLY